MLQTLLWSRMTCSSTFFKISLGSFGSDSCCIYFDFQRLLLLFVTSNSGASQLESLRELLSITVLAIENWVTAIESSGPKQKVFESQTSGLFVVVERKWEVLDLNPAIGWENDEGIGACERSTSTMHTESLRPPQIYSHYKRYFISYQNKLHPTIKFTFNSYMYLPTRPDMTPISQSPVRVTKSPG